jgi:hypothetical protein
MQVTTYPSIEMLADSLAEQNTNDDLLELIKQIDAIVQDISFTKAILKYCKETIKIEEGR